MPTLESHKKPWIPERKKTILNKSWAHDPRYHSTKWRNYRKGLLKRHPLCVDCKKVGKLTPSNVVGHIIPVSLDPSKFWDMSNHKALCTSCNNRQAVKDRKK